MKTVSTLFALCALALSIPAAGQYVANCNDGCTVVITPPAVCNPGAFKAVPEPIIVDSGKSPMITWQLAGDAWKFDAVKGIDIAKWPEPAPAFDNKKPAASGRNYTVKNVHRKKGVYKYDVNVVATTGNPPATCKWDPTIVNW